MRLIPVLLALVATFTLHAQVKQPPKKKPAAQKNVSAERVKYPSLLWEITGNGMKKPSYLFGTMHVSDKLAFHLGDSFYNAIKSVDVVALETNPENWQEDFSNSLFSKGNRGMGSMFSSFGNDRYSMTINMLSIEEYIERVKAALAMEPSMINGMLYRTVGNQMADFEEDTFLDLYIMQIGRKLGKRMTGVENFEESEKLVMEAYIDMMKDQNKKRRSYDFEGSMSNPKKLEEAYRKGDLDMLDSLQAMNVFSDAFQEKFLFKRNDIQAENIDSIMRSSSSLFVGVGAAHLPGKRGVIEILRRLGYNVRPVQMDDRNSVQKDNLDKIRYPQKFRKQTSDDKFYEVMIPGEKFYKFTEWPGMDVVQYADMVNGAYYMVNRIKTNGLAWGHDPSIVHKKVDSLLYENIPGKILKKTTINRNGYAGWDILNRTRRGDHQRYQIFSTPFEVIVFKMSGISEYITAGPEADQFFGSILLKPIEPKQNFVFSPPTGGFRVGLPHHPSTLEDDLYGSSRFEYAAHDKKEGNHYLVMQMNLHHYFLLEEDTFELNLMDESYAHSSFIKKEVSRRHTNHDGYPALETKHEHTDGTYSTVKHIIRGPVYYTLVVNHKKNTDPSKSFFESFRITPFTYPAAKLWTDSSMYFQVMTPITPDEKELKQEKFMETWYETMTEDMDEIGMNRMFNAYGQKGKQIGSDTTGEKVIVAYIPPGRYSTIKDTADLWKLDERYGKDDSTYIYGPVKEYTVANGTRIRETSLRDTGSSRTILFKWLYKDGHKYYLTALTDTLSQSPFIQTFLNTFTIVDSLNRKKIVSSNKEKFFQDFFSSDSVAVKTARKFMYEIEFDSTDVQLLKSAISRLTWKSKNYLTVKDHWITELGNLKSPEVVPFLRDLYKKVGDTAQLQNAILDAMLNQKTKESFIAFKDLILEEPPVPEEGNNYRHRNFGEFVTTTVTTSAFNRFDDYEYRFSKWAPLYDTLSVAKAVFPDLLELLNLEDYKEDVIDLLAVMVDSGHIKGSDYESFFTRFHLDAKQLLKKQIAKEEKLSMDKANMGDKSMDYYMDYDMGYTSQGNQELQMYAKLLLPFYKDKPAVQPFFDQLMKSTDKAVLYNAFTLLLRNGHAVHDSLFAKFAKDDDYRAKLFYDLKKMNKVDRFPAKYKTQELITRSIVSTALYKTDTLVFLERLPATLKDKKGYVYFYKYKQMKDDNFWKIASGGFQPADPNEIITEEVDLVDTDDRMLKTETPVNEQLQKYLRQLLNSMRPSASQFYDTGGMNYYKTYLSEMVKQQRYRD